MATLGSGLGGTDKRGAARAEQDIVRLCHAGLDSRTLRVEALRLLRKVIAVDSFWFATADPATLLFTSSVVEDIPEHATAAFIANEFLQADVNKWVELARTSRPANGLYLATDGQPDSSPRYREILAPLGFGDELRAALRDGRSCWGFMCLHREQSSPGFTPEEAAFLGRLTPHLATGVRNALLIGNADVVPGRRAGGAGAGGRPLRGRDHACRRAVAGGTGRLAAPARAAAGHLRGERPAASARA